MPLSTDRREAVCLSHEGNTYGKPILEAAAILNQAALLTHQAAHETLTNPSKVGEIMRLHESTSCGNRPVRRAEGTLSARPAHAAGRRSCR